MGDTIENRARARSAAGYKTLATTFHSAPTTRGPLERPTNFWNSIRRGIAYDEWQKPNKASLAAKRREARRRGDSHNHIYYIIWLDARRLCALLLYGLCMFVCVCVNGPACGRGGWRISFYWGRLSAWEARRTKKHTSWMGFAYIYMYEWRRKQPVRRI